MHDLLPAFGHLNPRLAVLILMALMLAAALPLALGWMKLLPPERDPFSRPDLPRHRNSPDRVTIFFLANVSLSFLAVVPGFADKFYLDRLIQFLPASRTEHITIVLLIWLVFVPALGAAYSAVRPNPIRKYLILGGILVLLLWLFSPTLLDSLSP